MGDRRGYGQNPGMGMPQQQQMQSMGGGGGGGMPMPSNPQQMQSMGMPPAKNFPGMPQAQMPAPSGGMGQGMNVPPQVMNATANQRYLMSTSRILPAVQENNPHMTDQVGQCIFDWILQMVGAEMAPKITGMLIDLPIGQIKQYLSSYDALQIKVNEAKEHLRQTDQM